MNKFLSLVLFFLLFIKLNYGQNIEWILNVNPTLQIVGTSIENDRQGNLYVTGEFNGTVDFNGTILNSIGQTDIFLAKYDTSGNFIWAKQAGGSGQDDAYSIVVDDTGNIFMMGLCTGPATFDTITLNDTGFFVLKYSNNGNIIWAKQIKGVLANQAGLDLALSKQSELFICGTINDSALFDTTKIYSPVNRDFFLAKFDSSGKFKWVKKLNRSIVAQIQIRVDVDFMNNTVISGSFRDTITFDTFKLYSLSQTDRFITKYDSSGTVHWARVYGTLNSDEYVEDVTILSNGDVFTASAISSNINGFNGLILSKHNLFGNNVWTTDTTIIKNIAFSPNKLTHDQYGNLYIVGGVNQTNFYNTKINVLSGAIAKFDSTGSFIWIKQTSDFINSLNIPGLSLDDQLNIYSTGPNQDSISGIGKLFVLKLSQTGIGIADSIVITNYKSPIDTAFKDNHTTSILADTNGIIYSGSKSGGLVVYDGITWRNYNTSNSSIPSDSISNLFLDDSNYVWICTFDRGIIKFDTINNWPNFNTGNSTIPTNHITCGEWRNDTIFLGSDLDDVVITDGVVWFGSYTNVYPGIPHDGVNSIKEDHNGNLWIATNDSGLVRVGSGGVTVYNYSNSGLPANTIQCLYVDANNTLWLGTDSNGLASFDGTNWRMFNSHNTTLPDNNIQSIVSGSSGKILVGTQSKGVGVFDGYTWELINDIIGLPDSNVISIIFSDSVYWAGMHDMGVVKFALPNDIITGIGLENLLHKTGNSLMCYPNPFTSRIVVSYSLEKISDTKIRMYDVMGKLVAERSINNQMPGKYELGINDISLPDGLCFLQLLTDKGNQTAKIVVAH